MFAVRGSNRQMHSAALLAGLLAASAVGASTVVRIKDLAAIHGTTGHKLIGYGLVVGLEGTGDSNRTIFTARSLANMLEQFGITVPGTGVRADNVAAVMVTAELPSQARVGTKIDVTVSSLGDAESLQGGTLLVTPLMGADREVYVVAQGPVSIGGFNVAAGGAKVQKNHPVVGRVPNGGQVVREVTSPLASRDCVTILLHNPDFTTAVRVAEAVNTVFGQYLAVPMNRAAVEVRVPEEWRGDVVRFVSLLETIPVEPDAPARVVINERTGTVIIGGNVRILPVAIAHGGLTVEIRTRWEVSQPPPLVEANRYSTTSIQVNTGGNGSPVSGSPTSASGEVSTSGGRAKTAQGQPSKDSLGRGREEGSNHSPKRVAPAGDAAADMPEEGAQAATEDNRTGGLAKSSVSSTGPMTRNRWPGGGTTVVVPQTEITAKETPGRVYEMGEQAQLKDLVRALNALGVTPRDLIAIIQALKELGALEAELVIQ